MLRHNRDTVAITTILTVLVDSTWVGTHMRVVEGKQRVQLRTRHHLVRLQVGNTSLPSSRSMRHHLLHRRQRTREDRQSTELSFHLPRTKGIHDWQDLRIRNIRTIVPPFCNSLRSLCYCNYSILPCSPATFLPARSYALHVAKDEMSSMVCYGYLCA